MEMMVWLLQVKRNPGLPIKWKWTLPSYKSSMCWTTVFCWPINLSTEMNSKGNTLWQTLLFVPQSRFYDVLWASTKPLPVQQYVLFFISLLVQWTLERSCLCAKYGVRPRKRLAKLSIKTKGGKTASLTLSKLQKWTTNTSNGHWLTASSVRFPLSVQWSVPSYSMFLQRICQPVGAPWGRL